MTINVIDGNQRSVNGCYVYISMSTLSSTA